MKTDLYLTAIKNLVKMRNFDELSAKAENGDISSEKYEKELSEHRDKYIVEVHNANPFRMVPIIVEIMREIGEPANDLTVDEVCTIFSIDSKTFTTEYEKHMKSKNSQLKIDFKGNLNKLI